ncbi:hypothetical protein DYB28_010252 [Aphanomyces astaci]|uniref:Thioredoxin domain-containing protein n=1 Tax=Aphanomyces astaci TaxID=112090 RepID=A0A397CKQ5_APHAT|nr:hypothetical protein DYB36_012678 [Aphanomyces astaci]RHY29411.1 hypothetical protein DYB25_014194 [Aphanomyces astaci]RHY44613.1 hypothetical protein DYB30_012790 [Aphanomyces astaci]RHY45303.1 hypothetical protein DYB38_012473 [Aphanomyces astaci]RHY75817.1 hypothetical protein DYB34_014185 [Aphanomyces astaci]
MVHTAPQGFWSDFYNGEAKPANLTDANGVSITINDLNPIVLVLLSAYWCPPCRALTPSLVQFAADNKDQVSVVYFSRDINSTMQDFNLSTKPTYNRYEWSESNIKVFAQLKAAYPSILGIPTLFAVDRDTGKVLSERAAVSIRSRTATVIEEWKRGEDITDEQAKEWWETTRGDLPEVDILPHLPLESIVDAKGRPVAVDSLNQFIILYFGAKWAQTEDSLTSAVASFASEHPEDVSAIYYSLDVEESDADKVVAGTDLLRFKWSQDLAKTLYNVDKIMTKDNDRNTLAAPRVLVYEKSTHKLVARHQYGILIKPTELLAAWKQGESGVTDDEINSWFSAKRAADLKKKEAEDAAKKDVAA